MKVRCCEASENGVDYVEDSALSADSGMDHYRRPLGVKYQVCLVSEADEKLYL